MLGGVFSVDDLTGFEITKIIELPEPYGIVALWGVLLPTIYVLAASITNLVFKDALILTVRAGLAWPGRQEHAVAAAQCSAVQPLGPPARARLVGVAPAGCAC